MNKKLLQKVIDELGKDKPDLSYVRGMLETMLEMNEEVKAYPALPINQQVAPVIGTGSSNLTPAEQAVMMADAGFVKGTKPGVAETNIVLN